VRATQLQPSSFLPFLSSHESDANGENAINGATNGSDTKSSDRTWTLAYRMPWFVAKGWGLITMSSRTRPRIRQKKPGVDSCAGGCLDLDGREEFEEDIRRRGVGGSFPLIFVTVESSIVWDRDSSFQGQGCFPRDCQLFRLPLNSHRYFQLIPAS
jgi:hypothetical protein